MQLTRRGFLGSILALAAAPAIVRADSLMRVVPRDTAVMDAAAMMIGSDGQLLFTDVANPWSHLEYRVMYDPHNFGQLLRVYDMNARVHVNLRLPDDAVLFVPRDGSMLKPEHVAKLPSVVRADAERMIDRWKAANPRLGVNLWRRKDLG